MKIRLKYLFSSLFFITITFVILGFLTAIVVPKTNKKESGFYHASAYAICNEPENSIDMLFLGTSQVYSTFIPLQIWNQIGITSYACSTPSQGLYYTEELLIKALKTQSPELVVLETDAVFENFSMNSVLEHKLFNAVPLLRYHSRWKSLTADDFSFNYDFSFSHEGKGFVCDFRCEPVRNENYMIKTDDVKAISEKSIEYLERIIKICNDRDIDILFISAPSALNWDYTHYNAICELSEKYNIEYVDMNMYIDEIGIDWQKDSIDAGKHLNFFGAYKATGWFADYISKSGYAFEEKDDETVSNWDSAVVDYNKTLAEHNAEI